jgi:hypothetical protein
MKNHKAIFIVFVSDSEWSAGLFRVDRLYRTIRESWVSNIELGGSLEWQNKR